MTGQSASSRTDAVLEAIDGALADRAVSPDAMRWTPDPPEQPRILVLLERAQRGEATEEELEEIRRAAHAIGVAFRSLNTALRQVGRAYVDALRKLAVALSRSQIEMRQGQFVLVPRPVVNVQQWQVRAPLMRPAATSLTAGERYQLALEARRNRDTGPAPDRLDGRRR